MNVDYLLMAHGFGGGRSKDKTPPPKVIGFDVKTSGNDAVLTWTNPVDTDFVGVAIVKNTSNYPTTVYDGDIIFTGNKTSFTDSNIEKAKYIYYRAFSYDYDNNYNTEDGQTGRALVKGYQSTPAAPTVEKVDYTSVTLKKYSDYEYKIANGSWQDSNVFNNLKEGTTYTFFQRKKSNLFYNASNQSNGLEVTTLKLPYRTMTAVIDQTNSNPLTCVTYEDDAVGMTKGSSGWDNFFDVKLVLFKNGQEVRELKDSELNGLSLTDGDVMVKFKRMGLNMRTVGDKVYVTMTDNPNNSNFKYYAHTRGTTRKEAFYLGAYLAFLDGSKLKSVTGRMPQDSKSITDFRTYAQNNGSGYDLCGFYQLTLLQAMYVLKYGNLDSQTALGKGLTAGNLDTSNATGATNGKGPDYGTTNGTQQMRFQFIEDFYGNRLWAIDGIATDSSSTIFTATDNFNNNRSGYKNTGITTPKGGGWIKKVQGTSELGFIGKEIGGSETTYYSDVTWCFADRFLFFGGRSGSTGSAGAFYTYFSFLASNSDRDLAARLMFL